MVQGCQLSSSPRAHKDLTEQSTSPAPPKYPAGRPRGGVFEALVLPGPRSPTSPARYRPLTALVIFSALYLGTYLL